MCCNMFWCAKTRGGAMANPPPFPPPSTPPPPHRSKEALALARGSGWCGAKLVAWLRYYRTQRPLRQRIPNLVADAKSAI